MSELDFYKTVDQSMSAEFKDKGSRFIAYTFPVDSPEAFKLQLQQLKKDHPKAVHHCFAYRIGMDGNSFRSSDDGEPAGTAGKPILGQIDSKGVVNIAIIVVRYFGGRLLGVPGLINAYKSAASMALQVTPIIHKQVEIKYSIQFDYTTMNEVITLLKQYNCTIISQELQLFCNIVCGIPKNRLQDLLYKFKEMNQVDVKKIN